MAKASGRRRQESGQVGWHRREVGRQRKCTDGRGRGVRLEVASSGRADGRGGEAQQAVEAGGQKQRQAAGEAVVVVSDG